MIPNLLSYRNQTIPFAITDLTEDTISIVFNGSYNPVVNGMNVVFTNVAQTIKGKGQLTTTVSVNGSLQSQITDFTIDTDFTTFQNVVNTDSNFTLTDSVSNPYPQNNHILSIRQLYDFLNIVNPSDFDIDNSALNNQGVVNTVQQESNFGFLSHTDKRKINDIGFFITPTFNFGITSTFQSIGFFKFNDKSSRLIITSNSVDAPSFRIDLTIYVNNDVDELPFVSIINNSSIIPEEFELQFRSTVVTYNDEKYLRLDVLDNNVYLDGDGFTISSYSTNLQLQLNNINNYRFICENPQSPTIINVGGLQIWPITRNVFRLDSTGTFNTFDLASNFNWGVLIPQSTDLATLNRPGYYYMLNGISTLTNIPSQLTTSFVMRIFDSGQDLHVTNYLLIDSNSNFYIGTFRNNSIFWKNFTINTDEHGNIIVPSHTHLATDIITDTNNMFVTSNDIIRWNAMAKANHAWDISTIIATLPSYTFTQVLLHISRFMINVSSLNIGIFAEIGLDGIIILDNQSAVDVPVTINFDTVNRFYFLGVTSTVVTVPANKSMIVNYLRLNTNELIFRAEPYLVSVVPSTISVVVGEPNIILGNPEYIV
jgi:hypothetical protein